MPIVVGGFGIGIISVILPLCAVAEVGPREIGPVSAITLMVQNLGGPLVLVVIMAVQTSRTLYLGGTTGPVKNMTPAQLDALGYGYTYSLLWVAGHRDPGRHRRVLDRLLGPRDRHARSTPGKRWRQASCRYAVAVADDARPDPTADLRRGRPAGLAADPRRAITHVPVPSLAAAAEAASLAVAAAGADGRRAPDRRHLHADRVVLRLHTVGRRLGHRARPARWRTRVTAALAARALRTGRATRRGRRRRSRSPSTRSTSR